MDTGLALDPGMSTGLAIATHEIGFETNNIDMDTGLAVNLNMSTGLGITNHEIGFETRNVAAQDIPPPPPPTPGLSNNLADMKLSASGLECSKKSEPKPTQNPTHNPPIRALGSQ